MFTISPYNPFHPGPGRVCLRLTLTLSGGLALFGILMLLLVRPVYAATITVTSLADSQANDDQCTLREAILNANNNNQSGSTDCAAGSSGLDTITFNLSGTITLGSALPTISEDLIIDGTGQSVTISGDNQFRVLQANAPLIVQGLTIMLGNASSGSGGGGIETTAALTLTNVNVLSNTAQSRNGGGVYVSGGATIISGSTFQNNRTTGKRGGGLYVSNNTLIISNTTFFSNTSQYEGGGGVYVSGGAATISNSIFQNNRSIMRNGGGLEAHGALALTNTDFLNNTAQNDGGGVWVGSSATISGGILRDNRANGDGGGLAVNGALALTGTQFIANSSQNGGGGLLQFGAEDGRVVNALFARNSADNGAGAAVQFDSSGTLTLLHTTIASPTLTGGAALTSLTGTVTISNSLITGHTIGLEQQGGTLREDFNLFFGNTTNLSGTITSGGNSLTGPDPAFANPDSDDYHLTAGSGAIDQGINGGVTTDFEGDSRPQGDGFDLGYDEMSLSAPSTAHFQFSPAAVNVAEEAGAALLTVTLTTPSSLTTSVVMTSANGTATAGLDYTPISQTLTFTPAVNYLTITLGISDDLLSETDETVLVYLGLPTNASLTGTNPATLTIVDNDDDGLRLVYLPLIVK